MIPGLTVRPAQPADAESASRLVYLTMGAEADWIFGPKGTPPAREVLEKLFIRRDNRASHNLAWLAECDGQAAGLLLAYPGWRIKRLDLRTAWHLLSISGLAAVLRLVRIQKEYGDLVETRPDEYYISNLGVLPEFQGQGIGARLMGLAEDLARECGLAKCSLIVSFNHANAQRLYERLGYSIQASYPYTHPKIAEGSGGFHRMIKELRPKVA